MKRFWEKSSEQQNRVLIVALSSNMTATKNIWWKTTSKVKVHIESHWTSARRKKDQGPCQKTIKLVQSASVSCFSGLSLTQCPVSSQDKNSHQYFSLHCLVPPLMFLICIMLSYSFSYILHLFRFVIWTLSNVSRGVLLQFYPPTFLSLFSWHFNYAWQILTSDNLTKSTISTMHMCTYLCTLHISGFQSDLEAERPSLWFGVSCHSCF